MSRTEISNEMIINSLEIIKEVCESNQECDECPFCVQGDICGIRDLTPENWNIVSIERFQALR